MDGTLPPPPRPHPQLWYAHMCLASGWLPGPFQKEAKARTAVLCTAAGPVHRWRWFGNNPTVAASPPRRPPHPTHDRRVSLCLGAPARPFDIQRDKQSIFHAAALARIKVFALPVARAMASVSTSDKEGERENEGELGEQATGSPVRVTS
jgi:hypothetical protein